MAHIGHHHPTAAKTPPVTPVTQHTDIRHPSRPLTSQNRVFSVGTLLASSHSIGGTHVSAALGPTIRAIPPRNAAAKIRKTNHPGIHRMVRAFAAWIHPDHPRDVDVERIRAFQLHCLDMGLSASYLSQIVSALKFLYLHLYGWRDCDFAVPSSSDKQRDKKIGTHCWPRASEWRSAG